MTDPIIEGDDFVVSMSLKQAREIHMRQLELEAENAAMFEALENLLAMTKHFIPDPRKMDYDPTYEDEQDWAIGQTYQQAEQALARVRQQSGRRSQNMITEKDKKLMAEIAEGRE